MAKDQRLWKLLIKWLPNRSHAFRASMVTSADLSDVITLVPVKNDKMYTNLKFSN
jgi:hypothetical protein